MNIKELLTKIANQDNLATQYPLYVVYDYNLYINNYSGNIQKFLYEGDLIDESDMQTMIDDRRYDLEQDELTEEEIEDNLDEFAMEFEEVSCEKVRRFIGVFLTREAAQQFIDANSYHWSEPHIYVESAWRNDELQGLLQQLFNEYKVVVPHFWQ